jgi:hypothetical protein
MFVFDSIARPTVLLDANAVRYCFKRDGVTAAQLELLRRTMREFARLDLVRFVITQPVGWELTAVFVKEGAAAYEAVVEFYLAIGSKWVLKHEYDRQKLELSLGRKLKQSEAFNQCDPVETLTTHRDPTYVERVYEMQRKEKDD